MSDPEAVERIRCDLRWKGALGLPLLHEGFHPTVLVYFRHRLRASANPRRIFDHFKQVAEEAGLLSTRGLRVLDSTPILLAVATQDTVSMIRGGIRRLLALVAGEDADLARTLRQGLAGSDYDQPAEGICGQPWSSRRGLGPRCTQGEPSEGCQRGCIC